LTSFVLALVATALATLGGREAVRVARLAASLGRSVALLVAGWLACLIAGLLAARLGVAVANELAPDPRTLIGAITLLAAAVELLVLRPGPGPAEPTRSFGAVLLVLGATQFAAAAGLLVFALAGADGAPWRAAAGGVLGSGVVFTAAWWMAGTWEKRMPLKPVRHGVAVLLVVAALVTGLSGRAWL
jgi:hypothetical protein